MGSATPRYIERYPPTGITARNARCAVQALVLKGLLEINDQLRLVVRSSPQSA